MTNKCRSGGASGTFESTDEGVPLRDSEGVKNVSAPLSEMDFPDGEFRPEASPEPHQNVGGLHVGFDATSEVVGPDFERAFRCLDLRTLKIEALSPHFTGVDRSVVLAFSGTRYARNRR